MLFAQQLAQQQQQHAYQQQQMALRQQQAQQQALYQQGTLQNQLSGQGIQRERLTFDQNNAATQNMLRGLLAMVTVGKAQQPTMHGDYVIPGIGQLPQSNTLVAGPQMPQSYVPMTAASPDNPIPTVNNAGAPLYQEQNALTSPTPSSPTPVPAVSAAPGVTPSANALPYGIQLLSNPKGVNHSMPTGNALLQHMDRNLRNYLGLQMMTNKPASLIPAEMTLSNAVYHNKGPFAASSYLQPQVNAGVTHIFDGTNLVPVQ